MNDASVSCDQERAYYQNWSAPWTRIRHVTLQEAISPSDSKYINEIVLKSDAKTRNRVLRVIPGCTIIYTFAYARGIRDRDIIRRLKRCL